MERERGRESLGHERERLSLFVYFYFVASSLYKSHVACIALLETKVNIDKKTSFS